MSARRAVVAVALVFVALGAVAGLTLIGWPASSYRHGAADMPQFWLAPRTLLEGSDPYAVWNWPYPLWTAIALLPLGALPLELAAPVWLVVQVVAVALILTALARRILVTHPRRDTFVLLGLALAMQPTWLLVGGGNMTGLLFAALGGTLLAQLSGRPFLAGALLGLVVTKPMAFTVVGPIMALSVRQGRARRLAGAMFSAGAIVVASFLLRPGWLGAWVSTATALQTSAGSNATGWTIGRSTAPFLPPWLVSALAIVAALGALVIWWRIRRPGLVLLIAGAIPVSLYVAPHGWSYDHLLLLITFCVTLERLASFGDRERALGLVVLATIAVVVPWLLYAVAVETGQEDPAALVPLLAFALLVVIDARRPPDPR